MLVASVTSQKVTSDFIPAGSSFLRKKLKDPTKPDTLSKADSVKDRLRTFIKEQIIGKMVAIWMQVFTS